MLDFVNKAKTKPSPSTSLRFLSTGDSFTTIASSFHGVSTMGDLVKDTRDVIWAHIRSSGGTLPGGSMKNLISLIVSVHLMGSMLQFRRQLILAPVFIIFYTFSVVLLALVDADYWFLAVDVGGSMSNSDGGIFANSPLGQTLQAGTLNVPAPCPFPSAPKLGPVPFVIVADEAFPVKTFLIRPYPGRRLPEDHWVFNYRLSRDQRIADNVFGILSQCGGVYQRRLQVSPATADSIIKATSILTNYLRGADGNHVEDEGADDVDGSALGAIRSLRGNRASAEALRVRDTFFNCYI